MGKNRSLSLGTYFEDFIRDRISEGRYKDANEVVRAGLRLLEDEENRILMLRNAIEEGMQSGNAADFDVEDHLKKLKADFGG